MRYKKTANIDKKRKTGIDGLNFPRNTYAEGNLNSNKNKNVFLSPTRKEELQEVDDPVKMASITKLVRN